MNDNTVFASGEQRPDGHEWLPLDTVRTAFQWLVTGPNPMAIHGGRFPGLPRRRVPLDELRDRLLSKHCPARTRDTAWAYLVRRSRAHGGAWTVACAGMALPSLAATARWFAARYRGDRADIHAAVLAGFVEALATVDLTDPGIAVRLHYAARRAGQTALEESLDAPLPAGPATYRSTVPRPPSGHPDLVLARAVGEQVLTPTEAELISATRLGETSVTDWARTHGAAVKTVFKARDRAEHRLVSWLRDHVFASDLAAVDDPVADAVLTALASGATTDAQPDPSSGEQSGELPTGSRAVSGRLRNGRPACPTKSSRLVSKNTPKSGLLGCGETPPTSPRTADTDPTSEVRRCA